VRNSPINFSDPTGHRYCDWDEGECSDDGEGSGYGSDYDWDPRSWSYGGGGKGIDPSNVARNKNDPDDWVRDPDSIHARAWYDGDFDSRLNWLLPTEIGWRMQIEGCGKPLLSG